MYQKGNRKQQGFIPVIKG